MPRQAPSYRCSGTLSRRAFLHAGLGALGLSDLLRLQSHAASGAASTNKAMIVLWLWGGPSHMETFDLKPDAPAEYRGEFKPIRTNVPGIEISEHLPRLARLADRFALIRSLHHGSDGHVNSTHTLMTGYPGERMEAPPYRPKVPDLWAVAHHLLGERRPGSPVHVALPRMRYNGAAYLGNGLDPLVVGSDPNVPGFRVPNLALAEAMRPRFDERLHLLHQFDAMRHNLDASGAMDSLDRFGKKAVDVLTSPAAARAFQLDAEPEAVRERYGRHVVGQRCLLARRLVEAGVRLVTVDFPTVPGQKAFSWDDHASVWNIFDEMKIRLPVLDQVVSALIEDLHVRGLHKDVLLVVMGEMSHTPKLNVVKGSPGREHWANSMTAFLAGGDLPMGQVIGSTNHKGEEPRHRPVSANDLLATWYKFLGVPLDKHFNDHAGRPVAILPSGRPVAELLS